MVEKEEIRDQIVSSARQVFSRFGFKKTTMDEIAQGARKGKSSIYYYFTSKEDIYRAVIEKEATILRDEVQKAITQIDDPIEKIKKYVAVRMQTFQATVNFYEAIKNELLSHLDFINRVREKFDKEEIQMLEEILNEGVKRNQFNIDNTELAAIAIVTAMKGLEIPFVKFNTKPQFDERIEHLLGILFYGIVKR